MSKNIKVGILGYADIAKRYFIPTLRTIESYFELVAIASHSQSRPGNDLTNIKWYDDYSYVINDETIELVYIPLPNANHFHWAKECIIRGKHVICEKSLGCNLKEVSELTELAIKNRVILFENFQFRFHNQFKILEGLLSNKKIGELRCLRASFGFPPFSSLENIRYNRELGGGALLDAGAYTAKVSQLILGKELQVKASNLNFDKTLGVDIWGGAYLAHTTGVFSEIAFGFDNFYQCGIEIWGSEGKISTNRLFTSPPGHSPEIIIETKSNKEILNVEQCNHFEKMLLYIYSLINDNNVEKINQEHKSNIDQSRILEDIRKFSIL